ncbi:MAG: hypothetical protein ACREH5_09090, partial [Candidatus Omnitrophota bacterium]
SSERGGCPCDVIGYGAGGMDYQGEETEGARVAANRRQALIHATLDGQPVTFPDGIEDAVIAYLRSKPKKALAALFTLSENEQDFIVWLCEKHKADYPELP